MTKFADMTDDEIRVKIAKIEAQIAKFEGRQREKRAAAEGAEGEGREPPSYEDMEIITDSQARCDAILQMRGEHAPRPLEFESARSYRVRALTAVQKFCSVHKDINVKDPAIKGSFLDRIENEIFADATKSIKSGIYADGSLVPVKTRDEHGRLRVDYYGSPRAAFAPFLSKSRNVNFTDIAKTSAKSLVKFT